MSGPGAFRIRLSQRAAACAVAALAVIGVSELPAQAALAQPAVVSDNPSDVTPHIVLDDTSFSVYDFAQVGGTVYAGGRFQQVQDWARTTTYARQNFVAFDAVTGVVSPLALQFDGMVTSLAATDTALYIGGAFAQVNGVTRRGIMKYDLVNNRIDPTFAPTGMRTVSDIVIANGAVIASGNFTKKIMALDPNTGVDTGAINVTVAGVVWTGDETRVQYLAVSPNGTRLVATGNFATVNGQSRKQAFMLNLGASSATLSTWHAPRFDVDCAASGARDVSAQGIDFSPDGSYFVIVATGGPTGTNGICDAAARFETANVSSTVQPTWINWTGGDTLYSVAVTGKAVYVGGHQRWLDNPFGNDSAGPGAVSRPGIGAIDPVTGKALPWNPTTSRFHGTMALLATPQGLWVGSDGIAFGREDHAGIGFAPLDPGPTPDLTRPETVIDSGPSGSVTDTSATFTFSASEPASFQCSLDGSAYVPCTSPVSYANLTAAGHTFRVVAVDPSSNVDATPAERTWSVAAPSSNLVGNPGFETDTAGWAGDVAANTVNRVAGGYSGGWAAEVSNSVAGGACGLTDKPSWVSFTQAGAYTVSIWVRSDTSVASVKLRIREYASGVLQGSTTASVTLTPVWQQVTAAYTTVTPGSLLDVEAYTTGAPVGVCFQADDAAITH